MKAHPLGPVSHQLQQQLYFVPIPNARRSGSVNRFSLNIPVHTQSKLRRNGKGKSALVQHHVLIPCLSIPFLPLILVVSQAATASSTPVKGLKREASGSDSPAGPMYVIKRNGHKEEIMFDKITSRIRKLCYGLDSRHVDPVRSNRARLNFVALRHVVSCMHPTPTLLARISCVS